MAINKGSHFSSPVKVCVAWKWPKHFLILKTLNLKMRKIKNWSAWHISRINKCHFSFHFKEFYFQRLVQSESLKSQNKSSRFLELFSEITQQSLWTIKHIPVEFLHFSRFNLFYETQHLGAMCIAHRIHCLEFYWMCSLNQVEQASVGLQPVILWDHCLAAEEPKQTFLLT